MKSYFYKSSALLLAVFVWTLSAPSSSGQASLTIAKGEQLAISGSAKIVALTFDDGPYGEPTKKILDILKEKNVRATFFLTGQNTLKYPELARREITEGHLIANHSYSHRKSLAAEDAAGFKKDVLSANYAISSVAEVHPRFYRPPFGLLTPDQQKVLSELGFQTVWWDDMTNDWEFYQTSENIVFMIIKRLKPGAIIVLHDGRDVRVGYPRENTLRALPVIIDRIREAGYEIVGLDRLIGQKPYFSVN